MIIDCKKLTLRQNSIELVIRPGVQLRIKVFQTLLVTGCLWFKSRDDLSVMESTGSQSAEDLDVKKRFDDTWMHSLLSFMIGRKFHMASFFFFWVVHQISGQRACVTDIPSTHQSDGFADVKNHCKKLYFHPNLFHQNLASPTVCFSNPFVTSFGQNWVKASLKFSEALFSFPGHKMTSITALLKVDFGSRSQSRVPNFYSTFGKKSTLKSTLLDFKSGKSDRDSTPPQRLDPCTNTPLQNWLK